MEFGHILMFFMISSTGFSAEISVFVQTGDSVQLDIQTQELPEFDDLSWRNNKSENMVKYFHKTKEVRLHSSYKDRVDFNNKTFSLTLKNMQKTDSGLYTARTSGESDNNIVTYRVSVIDAVEAPVLTVNSNWLSGNFCTVNFTCRAHELMINSSYQNNSCSPEEVTSQINTLILDCSEESIICNHSNPVSWKEDRINITQLCFNKENDSKNIQTGSPLLGPVVGLVAVCILICLSVFLYCKYKKDAQDDGEGSSVYAQVEAEVQTQEEAGGNGPNTVYCTVGQHQKATIPPATDRTIYSVVYKQPNDEPSTITSDDT
uniref:Si:dkey-53k12.1 n=1 Tax=Cyprinus carpio TaxID=7962 RepID=A0A8C2A6S2_CYPCA